MAVHRIPPPEPLPPITVDGQPIMIRGWSSGFDRFAFAEVADVDGKYQALVIRAGTFEHAWPGESIEDAMGIAAQEYVAAIGGPARAEIQIDGLGQLFWMD